MTLGVPDKNRAWSDLDPAPAHETIRAELQRVLADPEFLASEKRRDFLKFVVEETLAGRTDQLKGYTIATTVFGRSTDFDSGHDPIVRIQAGKLRRELERYYLVAGGDDPVRIDIPKGRYVPFFVEQSDEATAAEALRRDRQPTMTPAAPSVAVMPLVNLTNESDSSYFLDGLLSELTTELGRYQDIIAVPCGGTVVSHDDSADTQRMASDLGVRFVLGGTFRQDAQTSKIALNLTDAATGRQLWNEAYKQELDVPNLIAAQEHIARDVVGTIAGELGIISQRLALESRKKPPAELTTYEAILRYHHYMQAMTPQAYLGAFVALQSAVEREPEYGGAWSALANLYNHAHIRDSSEITDALTTATGHAQKGAGLEPRSQPTRTVMAYTYLLRGDLELALEEADVALALNPNSPYHTGTLGYILVFAGEFERGRMLMDDAMERNPCHPKWFHHGCWLDDYGRGDYEASYRQAWMAGPQMGFWGPVLCAASLGQLGREKEARGFSEEIRRLKPDFEERSRELMNRVLKSEELVDRIADGLRKAGLKIRQSVR